MKRILLFSLVLLLSIPAVTCVHLAEKEDALALGFIPAVQSNLNAEEISFSNNQLQQAVPQKTPRNVTTPRRRYTNSTLEFFTGIHFTLLAFGPGLGGNASPIRHTVFNDLGGEATFLFRLTPF